MRSDRGSVSIVVAGVVLIALVLCLGMDDVGRALIARSHARTAADAAALAVAQELIMPTGRDPSDVAVDYAERNGATVTSCACAAGTFDATVTVAIQVNGFMLVPGDRTVTSRARAVVDLPTASPSPSASGPFRL